MRTKVKPPSEPQARRLAAMWGDNRGRAVGGYIDPTTAVLKRNGWIMPTDKTGEYPNGSRWVEHVVSPAGLRALHTYWIAAGLAYGDGR